MRRSIVPRPRSTRWTSAAIAAVLMASACAPATPPGTPEPALPSTEPTVRVGISVDTTEITIGSTAEFEIRDLSGDRAIFRLGPSEQAVVTAEGVGGLAVRIGDRIDRSGESLLVTPTAGARVTIGGKPYRGTAVVRATGSGRLTAINQVDMEAYLLGVVPYEIGRVGPELLEASKAQAVAARTYAIRYLGRREQLGFDVLATVEDQVYGGAEGEHDPVSIAVRETAGQILAYQGEPIEAFYHSTCSGQTAAIEEVWPTEAPRPYLVSVIDLDPATGQAFDVTSSRFRWTVTWSADLLRETFRRTLADSLPAGVTDVGEILGFETLEHTPSGRIRSMRITTSTATFLVGGDRIRWIFLTPTGSILNSSKFELTTVRDAGGRIQEVVAQGMGWGHGIGMCQVGAMGRARAGQDYRSILEAYYPQTELLRLY